MKKDFGSWIYLKSSHPLWQQDAVNAGTAGRQEQIAEAVREAMMALTEAERLVIEKYYFEGLSYAKISGKVGKSEFAVVNLRRRAIRRLRKLLSSFVSQIYGLDLREASCPLCNHPQREEIDRIIESKPRSASYRKVIAELQRRFRLKIISPQTIIGHSKYHG